MKFIICVNYFKKTVPVEEENNNYRAYTIM